MDTVFLAITLSAIFILLIILAFLIYRRFFKKELTRDMSSKVSELVAKYATKVSEFKKKRNEKMQERLH